MPSFNFNSLAIRSSPHVAFAAAIARIRWRKSFGNRGLPGGFDFHCQNKRNLFPVPTDERVRFHVPQRIAPGEHSAQSRHHPPRGIVFSAASARRDRTPRPIRRPKSSSTIVTVMRQCCRAVRKQTGHERSGSHVTTFQDLAFYREEVFADDTSSLIVRMQQRKDESEHESNVVTWRNVRW